MFRHDFRRGWATAIESIVAVAPANLFDDGTEPKPTSDTDVAAFHRGCQTPCPQH